MNKENCALKLVDEIILYYDARSKKHNRDGVCLLRGTDWVFNSFNLAPNG